MAVKYILLIAICFISSIANTEGLQTFNGRIKITVGTTAGCSDTIWFTANLVEAYNLYKDFLDIEFIPWGRTIREDDGSLRCQFGVNDCWANRLHRCALNKLQGNLDAQVHYMSCEFTRPRSAFDLGSYLCAHAVGLNIVDVDHCVINPNDELDFEAERIGSAHMQALNFVPSIVFNDSVDATLHSQSLNRLVSMICFALAADPTTGVTDCPF